MNLPDKKPLNISLKIKRWIAVCLSIGFLTFLCGLFFYSPKEVGYAYLVPFIYFLFISLGSLFFLAVQFPSGAVWSINIRRIIEAVSSYLPWAALLFIPYIYFCFHVYEWLDPQYVKKDPILLGKSAYLNFNFFLIRSILFFAGWLFFFYKLIRFSKNQDKDGNDIWIQKSTIYSTIFLLFFVPSFSLLSVDTLMSLDAHWFSTIFGVYTFAGSFQSALAVMILWTIYLMPLSNNLINKNHLHDLSKFLMAMTLFWAYIAFSQYMLIWYANLPEETTFFVPRSKGPWMYVSFSLIIFKFCVPFICLLPRWVKRNTQTMIVLSILILIMQYVDIYWLVYPDYNPDKIDFNILSLGFFIGFLGVFIFAMTKFLSQNSIIPLKDSRSKKSDTHHVIYS